MFDKMFKRTFKTRCFTNWKSDGRIQVKSGLLISQKRREWTGNLKYILQIFVDFHIFSVDIVNCEVACYIMSCTCKIWFLNVKFIAWTLNSWKLVHGSSVNIKYFFGKSIFLEIEFDILSFKLCEVGPDRGLMVGEFFFGKKLNQSSK